MTEVVFPSETLKREAERPDSWTTTKDQKLARPKTADEKINFDRGTDETTSPLLERVGGRSRHCDAKLENPAAAGAVKSFPGG